MRPLQVGQEALEDTLSATRSHIDEIKGMSAVISIVTTLEIVINIQAIKKRLSYWVHSLLVVQLRSNGVNATAFIFL